VSLVLEIRQLEKRAALLSRTSGCAVLRPAREKTFALWRMPKRDGHVRKRPMLGTFETAWEDDATLQIAMRHVLRSSLKIFPL